MPAATAQAVLLAVALGAAAPRARAVAADPSTAAPPPLVTVACGESDGGGPGSCDVRVGGAVWLPGAAPRLHVDGKWWATGGGSGAGSLVPCGPPARATGKDSLGRFHSTSVQWCFPSAGATAKRQGAVAWVTAVRAYADNTTVVLEQSFPSGARGTQAQPPGNTSYDPYGSVSVPPFGAFPSFDVSPGREPASVLEGLGYLTWQGTFASTASGRNLTAWAHRTPEWGASPFNGLASGPLVLFDNGGSAAVVSPLGNDYKVAVSTAAAGGRWELGLSSELTGVPPGTTHAVVVSASRGGVRAAVEAWGGKMRRWHGTSRRHDLGVHSRLLGQWTDNGAGYESGATVGDLVEAQRRWKEQGVPIRYLQLDDWWYPGCSGVAPNGTACSGMWVRCVQSWDMLPQFSPRGLRGLQDALGGVPLSLYAMYWCRDNVWATEDGVGFVNGSDPAHAVALPDPRDAGRLFDAMFELGASVGMAAYEQDGLDVDLMSVPRFRTELGASSGWLHAMNGAAARRNLTVQYCMALPSDLLQSLAFDHVTNARATGDYAAAGNVVIGGTSLLLDALDLRPSKDVFWSSPGPGPRPPSGNPGTNCELNAVVACMSTGVVGVGDRAGRINATRVLPTCRADGVLLAPARPLRPLDAQFASRAFGAAPRRAVPATSEVWATAATADPAGHHFVLAVNLTSPFDLRWSDVYGGEQQHQQQQQQPLARSAPPPQTRDPAATGIAAGGGGSSGSGGASVALVVPWRFGGGACAAGADAVASGCAVPLMSTPSGAASGVDFAALQQGPDPGDNPSLAVPFGLATVAPVAPSGWTLLGEVGKYAAVSPTRLRSVSYPPDGGVRVSVVGAAGETVVLRCLEPKRAGDPAEREWTVVELRVRIEETDVPHDAVCR